MAAIKKVISCDLFRYTKKNQAVYLVVLEDGSSATSMTKFEPGETAKYIWDDEWQTDKIIPLKSA